MEIILSAHTSFRSIFLIVFFHFLRKFSKNNKRSPWKKAQKLISVLPEPRVQLIHDQMFNLPLLFQTMSLVWSITPQFWKSLLFMVPPRNPSESQSSRILKPIRKLTQFSSRKSPIPRSICRKPTFWFRFQVMVVHVDKKPNVWVEF